MSSSREASTVIGTTVHSQAFYNITWEKNFRKATPYMAPENLLISLKV
jgi:hypothetical protein